MHLPDYAGGSIVNVMASLRGALGRERTGEAAAEFAGLDQALLRESRHVVLLLVDGLGVAQLADLGHGFLSRRHSHTVTSVFPSTTASAITSVMTGAAPAEHGITGWYTWFREIASVAAPLPFRSRFGADLAAIGVTPSALFRSGPFFDQLAVETFVLQPAKLTGSAYSTHHCGQATAIGFSGLDDLADRIAKISCRPGRSFTYAYWPEFDSIAHEHGSTSRRARKHLRQIDQTVERLASRVERQGMTLIVTADHGFIDTEPHHHLSTSDHPELGELLALPLCGEGRSAFCYVRAGAGPEFERRVSESLGERALLVSSEQALDDGWFGPGPRHPRIHDRIGDYVLAMQDTFVIRDSLPGERRHEHVGVHGGTSRAEMEVPLSIVSAA